jgi:transposase
MGEPYGHDLRSRIVRAYLNKEGSVRELAERFAVVPNTVQNYLNLFKKTGSLEPRPHGGGIDPRIADDRLDDVRRLVQELPDATESELAHEFSRRHRIPVSRQTMGRALHRIGWTRKKNASRHRA